ncbi:hypothetical protein [Peribacillus frigoritolerans]|uniref:hypothetical protein n=1 Tax=Peribacillus frigoritolerans TaxID=450367 RepID=UPI0021616062|nr:hypothetical protein [Peribacillus frigoritolerans]
MALKELYTELEQNQIFYKEMSELTDYEKEEGKLYEQKLKEKELITRRFLRLELTLRNLCLDMAYIGNAKELEETLEEFVNMIYSELLGNLRIMEKELEWEIGFSSEEYRKENDSKLRQNVKDINDKYNLVLERLYKKKLNELDSLIY